MTGTWKEMISVRRADLIITLAAIAPIFDASVFK
jgi:hypothetical protein